MKPSYAAITGRNRLLAVMVVRSKRYRAIGRELPATQAGGELIGVERALIPFVAGTCRLQSAAGASSSEIVSDTGGLKASEKL